VTEQKDTGLHDDGYSTADGVWDDDMLWINDTPGIEVSAGETIEYSFYHRQTLCSERC
jgi:hypothetical protein